MLLMVCCCRRCCAFLSAASYAYQGLVGWIEARLLVFTSTFLLRLPRGVGGHRGGERERDGGGGDRSADRHFGLLSVGDRLCDLMGRGDHPPVEIESKSR
jgi:hypothetical protein